MYRIQAVLKRIAISKEMFIKEISYGQEVYIPKDLSQKSLPLSMKYYDSIIQLLFRDIDY